jgi:hypothetical protein
MNELVTIRSFGSSMDFEMAKSYLESFGIECFGMDEFINRTYVTNVAGGIKLQVLTQQSDEAIQLLLDGGYLKPEDFEPSPELKWVERIIRFFSKNRK